MREAELEGRRFINRKIGNKLARVIGASKYVECSGKSGQGITILFDEIVYAYFAKLKDEEERRKSEICEKEQIDGNKIKKERREKFYRDSLRLFVFGCLMVIIFRVLGLETNFLWSWSRLFCNGLVRGLEPSCFRSRSLKWFSKPGNVL